MLAISILRNSARLMMLNPPAVLGLGLVLGLISNAAVYLMDFILNFDTSGAASGLVDVMDFLVFGGVLVLVGVVFFLLAPFEILLLRTFNSDITERPGAHRLGEAIIPYTIRYFGIFVLATLTAALIWALFPNVIPVTDLSVPIMDTPLREHASYLWETWLSVRSFDIILSLSMIVLALQIIGIALGHTVKFFQAVKFQLKRIGHILLVALVFDTLFFLIEIYLAGAFGRLYLDVEFSAVYFVFETVLGGIYAAAFLAVMTEFYRIYHDQAFENTKAASKAASVFE